MQTGDELFTIITNLLHFGMTVVFAGQMKVDEITGGAPYGATTIGGLRRSVAAAAE